MVLNYFYHQKKYFHCFLFSRIIRTREISENKTVAKISGFTVIADVCDSVSRPKTVHECDCLTVVPVCLYPCGMCSTECSDNPVDISEESVCCDSCSKWFHLLCVSLSRCPNKNVKWFCPNCKISRKRKRIDV